jgi:predicted dienelactone hydrolase
MPSAADGTPSPVVPRPTDGLELGKPGPYGAGFAPYKATDPDRADREISVIAYYPSTTTAPRPQRLAPSDASGAPYPVIVSDDEIGPIMGPHLASHGFVYLSVQSQYTWGFTYSPNMVDYPLDQVVALNALETLADHPAAGLGDTSRSAALGYSFGAWDTLMLAGARVDPAHQRRTCATRPADWSEHWWQYTCGQPEAWQAVVDRAEALGIARDNGLWASMGDDRIKAVMPMGPEGFDLTGPAGLAEARVPALLIAAGSDTDNDYDPATTSLFEHYPAADLITFVGAGHMMVMEGDAREQMRRFATAFLGLHLQGRQDYARYLTEDYVEEIAPGLGAAESFETLAWGVP